ncbi:MAG: iron-containing alcohol dehydrogenase, partial [bacterium]
GEALPLVTVLTLAATGSEMNSGCVITNEETKQKFNAGGPGLFPKTSILDPETTFSVPKSHTAYGAMDCLAHLFEGYFTTTDLQNSVSLEITEGLCRSIIASTEKIMKNPRDYEARASMMWSCALALNGLPVCGFKDVDFINHAVEHSLSAIHDIAHGAGLAIVMPAWLSWKLENDSSFAPRMAGFSKRVLVLEVTTKNEAASAADGIKKLKAWFKLIGAPVTLREAGIKPEGIPEIASNSQMLMDKWGIKGYPQKVVEEILGKAIGP